MPSVLITGTSSGFGLNSTVELARRGWQVFATMRNLDKSAPLAQAVARAGIAQRVTIERLDVTDAESMRAYVAELLERTSGRLDAVVHNAGVAVGAAFEDVPEAQLRLVMETNFFGVLELTRLLLPTFRARRRGRIVVVSSNSAYAGEPANSIYCASKWAVEGWAESIAFELDPFGVDVVLIEPGPYRTEIWNSSPRIRPASTAYGPLLDVLEKAVDEHVAKDARSAGGRGGDRQGAQRSQAALPLPGESAGSHRPLPARESAELVVAQGRGTSARIEPRPTVDREAVGGGVADVHILERALHAVVVQDQPESGDRFAKHRRLLAKPVVERKWIATALFGKELDHEESGYPSDPPRFKSGLQAAGRRNLRSLRGSPPIRR